MQIQNGRIDVYRTPEFWGYFMDELPTVEECLLKAQEYLALAESTPDAMLRTEYLALAKELTELAATLDGSAAGKGD
jgi:hypothetical protein